MNIAMFTNDYAPIVGGVARSVETFTRLFCDMGHRVLVVTLSFPDAETSTENIFRLPAVQEIAGTQFSFKLPIPSTLNERLDAFKPDIIHSHHPFMLGDTALRVARTLGLPLLFTHHTMYERYAYLFQHDSKIFENFCEALATEYANLCDYVIAPTPSIKDIIRKRGVSVPVDVIPSGVDVQKYSGGDAGSFRERHEIPADAFVVGYLGRIEKVKNMAFLARAVLEFLKQCSDAWFVLAGYGESVDEVKHILVDGGVAGRFVTTGEVTGQAVADAYAAMDVLAFASKTETQGIVLAEALSAGLPIIALDAPGPRDIVSDGSTGRLLDGEADENTFARALHEICVQDETRRAWSEAARRSALDYDEKRCAEKLLSRYKETQRQQRPASEESLDMYDSFLNRFTAEWGLFREKLAALTTAVTDL